jgi:hypothetical protein
VLPVSWLLQEWHYARGRETWANEVVVAALIGERAKMLANEMASVMLALLAIS